LFVDGFERRHHDLRVSVTDRCNLRCSYCMPEDPVWYDREELLSYEELLRIVRVAARRGVRRVRITGGEPLVRRDLPDFVAMLAGVEGLEDLSLTTNGILLARHADALVRAGLRRINVSLDTLDANRFFELTRRRALDRVLEGLRAATAAGLAPVKINTVMLRGVNDDELEPLVERARREGWELRFIEFMPLDNDRRWDPSRVVPGPELRARIQRRWPLRADPAPDPHAPATRFRFLDGQGAVGFIDSVTRPFCGDCSRLRLTCDGKFRVCLYDPAELDLKTPLREGASDGRLAELMARAVAAKGRGGALEILERGQPLPAARTMHQIGG